MNKITNIVVSLIAVVALVIGAVAYNKTPVRVSGLNGSQGIQGIQGERGPVGPQGPAGRDGKDAPVKLGSIASPDFPYNYFGVGGVRVYKTRTSLIQGSSTVCAIQSPAATSTLLSANLRFALASTSAVIVDLAKDSTPYATTTKIGSTYGVPGSAQATIVASTTGSVAGDATIFAPNSWFVARMVGVTVTAGGDVNNVPSGFCQVSFEAI